MRAVFRTTLGVMSLMVALCAQSWAKEEPQNIAVAIYLKGPKYEKFEAVAKTRLEELLIEAGHVVLDEAKTRELRENWIELADPGHLITAEEILERAKKYHIDKVARISVVVDVQRNFDLFYSATATAELRLIDTDAKVVPTSSRPMGVLGFPPSDGLTEAAAITNAIQRAVESVAQDAGWPVAIPTTARLVTLDLVAATLPADAQSVTSTPQSNLADPRWQKVPVLFNEKFKGEDVACTAISPDQQMGALGGYTWAFKRIGRTRQYGGRIHLVDIPKNKVLLTWTLHELAERSKGENGSSAPLACAFLGSWRYLIAVTGNKISCFDVERGVESCAVPLPDGPGRVNLELVRAQGKSFIKLRTDRKDYAFQVVLTGQQGK